MFRSSSRQSSRPSVRLAIDAFEAGDLPEICVLSGRQATTTRMFTFHNRVEQATGWLILLGVFPFVLVRAITRKTTRGPLPISSEELEARLKASRGGAQGDLKIIAAGTGVGGLAGAVIDFGLISGDSGTGFLFGGLAAGALFGLVATVIRLPTRPQISVRGAVEPSGRWLSLEGVHPDFVDAYATWSQSTPEPRGPGKHARQEPRRPRTIRIR